MDNLNSQADTWEKSDAQVFWGEVAPCNHMVQIYEDNKILMNTLVGFVSTGLVAGESVVIIATQAHLEGLSQRLISHGFNLQELIDKDIYIPIEAEYALSNFMVNNWPDEHLFEKYIHEIIKKASENKRKVRAFGEMVALLWAKGMNGATHRLEFLWNKLHATDQFTLYCAYPKSGFTQDVQTSIDTICSAHAKIIDGKMRAATEIYYKDTAVAKHN
jgi:hypothetical protein